MTRINNIVLYKPAQIGETPEMGNTEGKTYMLINMAHYYKNGGEDMEDLTDMRFGKWTVLERSYDKSKSKGAKWLCQCECGSKVELVSHLILSGHTQSCGCLRSEKNSRGEMFIRKALDKFNVQYIPEHSFNDCFGINGGHLRFDFYLPKHNIVIEFDGKQHFHPIEYWGGNQAFEIRKQNDNIKNIYCKEKHILLLRLPYTKSKDDIIEQISTYINI